MNQINTELLEALKALIGPVNEPKLGWRSTRGTKTTFVCEFCNKRHEYCTLIVHLDDCPIHQARAAIAKAEQAERVEPVGQPYGIVDPDYARVFTQARIVAWQYGYACVMHGSFTRDLDLLLVPWTEQARDNYDQLMKLIAHGCGLRFADGKEDVLYSTVDFTDKPHGRKSCSLYFPQFGDRRWIDISIVPVTPPAAAGVNE
jgi:hypothetical protein